MDAKRLKASDVCADLHVAEQTIHQWRSFGVPPRRMPHVVKYMAEWVEPSQRVVAAPEITAEAMERLMQDQILIQPTAEQYERWDRASRAAAAPSFKEWIINGLDQLAKTEESGHFLAFPEISLFHAAAGSPASADHDVCAPIRDVGPGRIACQLHGDSMAPTYPDGSTVILRERSTLKRPLLKNGEIYLFILPTGERTLKVYNSRKARPSEIEAGISYVSPKDGKTKVHVLESINPEHAEIVVDGDLDWIAWLDQADN
jgi:hypothetical protein